MPNEGSVNIVVNVGLSESSCIIPTICTTNGGYCSSTLQSCIINAYLGKSCYSSAFGGNIYVSISKPSYSELQACSPSAPSTLFIALLNVTSVHVTPSPSLPYALPPTSASLLEVQGAPFYAITVVVVACIMYGVVLTRLRDASEHLGFMRITKVCATLGLFGSSVTSEIAYIATLFTQSTDVLKRLAVVVLIARFFYLPGGMYIITKLIGSSGTNRYMKLTDKEHLLINRKVYAPLFIMILFDNTNVAYLPWLPTKFNNLSDGYPDLRLYKICVYVKIVQSLAVVIIQIAVLGKLQSHGFRSLSLVSQAFLCISIASSIISLTVTTLGILLQASLLKTLSDNDDDDGSGVRDISSIHTTNPMSTNRIGKLPLLS